MGAKSEFASVLLSSLNVVAQCACTIPEWQPLRYDEDYRALRDPICRQASVDALKYHPIGDNRDRSLRVGGEVRERHEYLDDYSWGLEPHEGGGSSIQRYT